MKKALIILLTLLALPASAQALTQNQANSRAKNAAKHGHAGIASLVNSMRAASARDKEEVWLALKSIEIVNVVLFGFAAEDARIKRGCHRSDITASAKVTALFYTFGSESVTLHGFCWNGKRITEYGGATYTRSSSFLNCWTNTSEGDSWIYYATWRRSFADGQLGGGATNVACGGLQTVNVSVTYANGGGVWRKAS